MPLLCKRIIFASGHTAVIFCPVECCGVLAPEIIIIINSPLLISMKSAPTVLDNNPYYGVKELELASDLSSATFRLWSPEAEEARVNIYPSGKDSEATEKVCMTRSADGIWVARINRRLTGMFYTFAIKYRGRWLKETPGIWAKTVGINGERAAVIDMSVTDPDGWSEDRGPILPVVTDAVIYELHYRDFSMHPSGGFVNKGKFLALTEDNTHTLSGEKTGIGHLKELGITHVQLMPSFDFNSVDEEAPYPGEYNWGYDPLNYNVPEGSYSSDPWDPALRIREFKMMIKSLHDNGIGVIMDVVYNHTAVSEESNFSLTAPGYFYRYNPDGTYSDASGCGNETASERGAMRRFIVESLAYWATEYHIDGFRIDLMGIHDIDTIREVAGKLRAINPDIILYGEGWTAGPSVYPSVHRAVKENVSRLDGVAIFSDDLRDAVKGDYAKAADRGFVSGKPGLEEAVKAGIVAATSHLQVDFSRGNKSKTAYASSPVQIINYVSCHDDLCLTDKLMLSMPDADESEQMRAARLAQTIIFTSQGIPFMFAGEEIFRSKKGIRNSYKSPDAVNAIDWELKLRNRSQFDYYRELIALRREHPAFRLTTAREISRRIHFDDNEPNSLLVSYTLDTGGTGDRWSMIRIAFNGSKAPQTINVLAEEWLVIADDGEIRAGGLTDPMGKPRRSYGGVVNVAPMSALILALPFDN